MDEKFMPGRERNERTGKSLSLRRLRQSEVKASFCFMFKGVLSGSNLKKSASYLFKSSFGSQAKPAKKKLSLPIDTKKLFRHKKTPMILGA